MSAGRTGTPIQVYLPPGMKEMLVEVARKNMRKISAEVVIALQAHLEANGHPLVDSSESTKDAPTPAKPRKPKK